MTLWYRNLVEQVDSTTELVKPNEPVKAGERIIGEMGEELKRLYSIKVKARFESNEAKNKLTMLGIGSVAKAVELEYRADLLDRLFWFCLNESMKLWETEGLGVRDGYLVVEVKSSPTDILRKLLGG